MQIRRDAKNKCSQPAVTQPLHKLTHGARRALPVDTKCFRIKNYVVAIDLARLDQADLRGGVAEVGLRYYEAVACGSVLIGEHPPRDMIERSLGNPPGLFDLPGGCTSMPGDIGEMLTDDRAVIDLGVANRRVGLQHLDVSHRWDVMAGALGLGDTPGVVARRAALAAELASLG